LAKDMQLLDGLGKSCQCPVPAFLAHVSCRMNSSCKMDMLTF